MRKIVKLSIMELSKMFKTKGIYIGLLLAIGIATAIGIEAYFYPDMFDTSNVTAFYVVVTNIIIMVYSAKSFGDEFQLKISTQIFTSKLTREQVIIYKFISLLLLSFILVFIETVVFSVFKYILPGELTLEIVIQHMVQELFSFTVYTCVVSTFSILVSLVNFSTTSTLIASFGGFLILPNLLRLVIQKYPELEAIIQMIPFLSADELIASNQIGIMSLIILILCSITFFVMSIICIENKDLR